MRCGFFLLLQKMKVCRWWYNKESTDNNIYTYIFVFLLLAQGRGKLELCLSLNIRLSLNFPTSKMGEYQRKSLGPSPPDTSILRGRGKMPTQDHKMHLLKDLHFSSQGGILGGWGAGDFREPALLQANPEQQSFKNPPREPPGLQKCGSNSVPSLCKVFLFNCFVKF